MDNLDTPRLVIRSFTMDDLDAVHQLLDLDLEWGGPGVTLEQRRARLRFQIDLANWNLTGRLYGDRAIVLKPDLQLIGLCGFRPWVCTPAERAHFDPALLIGEPPFNGLELGVGYALSSRHRGQGYAAEAVKALIEHAFTELGIQRVVALTTRENSASVNVMKRTGMTVGQNPAPVHYPGNIGIIENSLKSNASET